MCKKIFFVANSCFPMGAANSVNVFRMTSSLARQGHPVLLLARRSFFSLGSGIWKESHRRYGEENRAHPWLIWWPFKRGAEITLTLVALLILPFLGKGVVIHTRIRYVAYLTSFLNYPVIYESHLPPQGGLQKKMESRLLQNPLVHLVVISLQLRRIYQEMGFCGDKIRVAPDAGRKTDHPPSQKKGHPGPAIHLGYIGSLYQGRGFEVIVEIAKQMPERSFHIIGDPTPITKPIKDLPHNITLYDQVTPHQAEVMTRLFDILLMPYQKEVKIGIGMDTSQWMSPLKMFEYLHSGRPMIASNLPVLREVLRDSENCLLVPPDDVDQWIVAIKKLDDEKLRLRLTEQALSDARQYTWDLRSQDILSHISLKKSVKKNINIHEYTLHNSN